MGSDESSFLGLQMAALLPYPSSHGGVVEGVGREGEGEGEKEGGRGRERESEGENENSLFFLLIRALIS